MDYHIYIINGPNLNLLGRREVEIYGSQSFEDYFETLKADFPDLTLHYFQSNHEGEIIDFIQKIGYRENTGIIINPAAYTHTSIAIADCIAAIQTPCIEVHISDILQREDFRHLSYVRPHVISHIQGEGLGGYRLAITRMKKYLKKTDEK